MRGIEHERHARRIYSEYSEKKSIEESGIQLQFPDIDSRHKGVQTLFLQ